MAVAAVGATQFPPVRPGPERALDGPRFSGAGAEQPTGSGTVEACHEMAVLATVVADEAPVPGAAGRLGTGVECRLVRPVTSINLGNPVAVIAAHGGPVPF